MWLSRAGGGGGGPPTFDRPGGPPGGGGGGPPTFDRPGGPLGGGCPPTLDRPGGPLGGGGGPPTLEVDGDLDRQTDTQIDRHKDDELFNLDQYNIVARQKLLDQSVGCTSRNTDTEIQTFRQPIDRDYLTSIYVSAHKLSSGICKCRPV